MSILNFTRRREPDSETANSLVPVVAMLPPEVRQAMQVAASTQNLKRRTWRGCPLQEAGRVLGHQVRGVSDAIRVLNVDQWVVRHFIHVWDNLKASDDARTALLRQALVEARRGEEVDANREAEVWLPETAPARIPVGV